MNADGGAARGGPDLIVVGAGSAGFSAAITAADLDARVLMIGHGTIGGTCVNVGCVPSKTLIRATEALHQARAASRFAGIRAKAEVTDWRALVAQKDDLVAGLRQAKYIDLLPAYDGITYREGKARLIDGGVSIDGETIACPRIVIATGSSPAVPPIEGMADIPYLTSTTALELERLPRSLLVIGGGYIGCELAQVFARAGVAVTIVCRRRLLPEGEPEISAALTGYFRDEGITVRDGIAYRSVGHADDGVALAISGADGDETLTAEALLLATGRRPNTAGLGLDEIGVETDPGGGIRVDAGMQTSRPGVFAAGDVTGRDMFVYMAAYGARIAAENALGRGDARYDDGAMPAVTFSAPQAASVGLTEAMARARDIAVESRVLTLDNVPRALAARDTRGLIKLVAEKGSGRLLGAHILAPEGADAIQTAVMAIKAGMTVAELGATIFPYLTTVEGLKLAAQTFEKDVSKLSCCAG